MSVEQDNYIEKIIKQVLCEYDDISFSSVNPNMFEHILNKHTRAFSDALNDLCPEISIGLKIGLCKRFVEFTIKNISELFRVSSEEELNNLFEVLVSSSSKNAAELENSNIVVYVIYRELKKTIDDICKNYKN